MSTKLVEAFTATELPVGHLDAFKEGAAYGYLLAKRQMVEAIDNTVIPLQKARYENDGILVEVDIAVKSKMSALLEFRDYVRNYMLFKKE